MNDEVTGSIVIIGDLEEKQTLTADTASLADEDGLGAFNYQWLRDGSAIAGATGSTYTTTASDIDKALSVTISYTDGYGTVETITSGSTSLIINDTSKAATFSITSSADSYDEGQSALFSLVTNNLAAGTAVAYTLSGISESDLESGSLTGTAIIRDSGTTVISISLAADAATEGAETLTITLNGFADKTASVIINDTSKNPGTVTTSHLSSILVDKGILGASPIILEGLTENIEKTDGVTTSHVFSYNGSDYDYDDISPFIMIVVRDNEFTDDFRSELADFAQEFKEISYQDAVAAVGLVGISDAVITVAGADGNYVG